MKPLATFKGSGELRGDDGLRASGAGLNQIPIVSRAGSVRKDQAVAVHGLGIDASEQALYPNGVSETGNSQFLSSRVTQIVSFEGVSSKSSKIEIEFKSFKYLKTKENSGFHRIFLLNGIGIAM